MNFLSIATLITVIALALVLGFTLWRGREQPVGLGWLLAALVLAGIAVATFWLPETTRLADRWGRGFVMILALIAMLTSLGARVIVDGPDRNLQTRWLKAWFGVSGLWLALTFAAGLLNSITSIGQLNWLASAFRSPDAATLVTLVGLVLAGTLLLGIAFYGFYKALMPEVANRALFWALDTAIVLMAIVTIGSGAEALIVLGMVILFIGMAGAAYGHISYRVIDIRSALVIAARTFSLIVLTAMMVFVALLLGYQFNLRTTTERVLVLGALALVVAALYMPVRQLAEAFFRWLVLNPQTNAPLAARQFSRQVSQAVDLNSLVQSATETLNQALRVRRSGLILVSSTGEGIIELSIIAGGGFANLKGVRATFQLSSPLFQSLAVEHTPLLQFDVDFNPRYKDIDAAERQFFKDLQMSAYAPIVVENSFIGLLACGPKLADTPFRRQDMELLATMAHQTGVALRNARLVVDLKHLNESMKSLNRGLETTKDELEKLDSVKTDFVTIASHELRTPLAQIRGYGDILDALNEQGMLDKDQLTSMVINLRKATERMEELISAMLDVSQLDVNAMDLRFAQTTPESVVRLAIEPLTDAIKQRKLTLSARGLRGLPKIQADMQRLVQAFRNIVVNAIKFTPDGGLIEINATLQPATAPDETEHILIAIQDSGVGIAREHLELVFKKFFRAYDPSLHSTGTYKFLGAGPGLGLTIAKGVIEGHGGKIWVESPGHDMDKYPGSTFYVLLPVSPPKEAKLVLPFTGDAKAVSESAKA